MDPISKPKQRGPTVQQTALFLFSATIIYLTHASLPPPNTLPLPPCGHIALITATRHGSSWFLNSAERCTANHTFHAINKASELWNRAHLGPVRDIPADRVVQYILDTHSIKIFPLTYLRNSTELVVVLQHLKLRNIPTFLLTRNTTHAYSSQRTALQTQKWNVNRHAVSNTTVAYELIDQVEFARYHQRLQKYFLALRDLMKQVGLQWDEVDYDSIVHERFIIGTRNRCLIKNCNW